MISRFALLAAALLCLTSCGPEPRRRRRVETTPSFTIEPAKPKRVHAKHEHAHLHPHPANDHHHHPHPHPHMAGADGHHHPY